MVVHRLYSMRIYLDLFQFGTVELRMTTPVSALFEDGAERLIELVRDRRRQSPGRGMRFKCASSTFVAGFDFRIAPAAVLVKPDQ